MTVELRDGGGLLDVPGFRAQGVHAGIKRRRRDVCLIVSDRPCTAAAVFTTNKFVAAPLTVCRDHLGRGDVRAIAVNAGNANACTGAQGLQDARDMAAHAAKVLGLEPHQVLVSSTGIIGRAMPMDKVRAGLEAAAASLDEATGGEAAEAITTTDTHTKEVLAVAEAGGRTFRVAGIAKGAGMIHPNMATMLAFLVTDAPIEAQALDGALRRAVDATFNMITVDGDQSTNDTVAVLANGAEGGAALGEDTPAYTAFEQALHLACRKLARMIARDGEGATVLLEVRVAGAASLDEARAAARTIASSNLVKSAVHGKDPNWGRIVAALGRSGVDVDPSTVSLTIEGNDRSVRLVEQGQPIAGAPLDQASEAMKGDEVRLLVELGQGDAVAEAWGCDLTEAYVKFNAAYTT